MYEFSLLVTNFQSFFLSYLIFSNKHYTFSKRTSFREEFSDTMQSKSIYILVPHYVPAGTNYFFIVVLSRRLPSCKKSHVSRGFVWRNMRKGRREVRSERRMVRLGKYRLYNGFTVTRSRTSIISSSIV